MRSQVFVLTVFGLAVHAGVADAQTAYARNAKDTLRFREVTSSEVRMTTPQGEFAVPVEQDATVGVVFLPGDSARAWYEALRVSVTAPTGVMAPETTPVLKQPFMLNVDSRGRTKLISAPKFPDSFQGIADLAHQFDDFFFRLPAQPLKVGLTWTDTTTVTDSGAGKWLQAITIAQYRVERDSTVGGEAAMVVSAKRQLTIASEGPVPGQELRAETQLSGTDDGYFLFAPKSGRMLGRQRKGAVQGQTTMSGAGGSMNMAQSMTFSSRIDVVK